MEGSSEIDETEKLCEEYFKQFSNLDGTSENKFGETQKLLNKYRSYLTSYLMEMAETAGERSVISELNDSPFEDIQKLLEDYKFYLTHSYERTFSPKDDLSPTNGSEKDNVRTKYLNTKI